jgi:hypothetical protein
MFGELYLEKDVLSWLSIGSSVTSRIILSRKRLSFLRVVLCLWLSDNSDIFYGKTSTSNILTFIRL